MLAALVASAGLALVAGAAPARAADSSAQRLPDLIQTVPNEVSIKKFSQGRKRRYRIGFRSSVENAGQGYLALVGRRTAQQKTMTAEQVVQRYDGSLVTYPSVGQFQFISAEGHQHWHLLGFDRFELRSAKTGKLRRDHKQGFCVGDRYRNLAIPIPAGIGAAPFAGNQTCGRDQPGLLTMSVFMSAGYGDDYHAYLEGQYIDITKIRTGTYVLVHRVNSDRKLRESDYTNNASSLRIKISYPRGRKRAPKFRTLKACPGTDVC